MSESTPDPADFTDVEHWLAVVGYESLYEVSDWGRVRGLDRYVPHAYYGRQLVRGGSIQPFAREYGHLIVRLNRDGVGRTHFVHGLVAEAFIGPKPDGLIVLHGPGGVTDNRPANLSYGTALQNQLDRRRDGTQPELHRTHCLRQHPLEPPNLVASRARKGHRICLACARAKATVHNARKRHGIVLDFEQEADRHYVLLCAA